LFAQAVELPVAERTAFLDAACRDDPMLRRQLEALLAAHEKEDALLDTLPAGAGATVKIEPADEAFDRPVGQTIGRY